MPSQWSPGWEAISAKQVVFNCYVGLKQTSA